MLDRRVDKNASIGLFELAYRQAPVVVPAYIGVSLCVEGQLVKKPLVATGAEARKTVHEVTGAHGTRDGGNSVQLRVPGVEGTGYSMQKAKSTAGEVGTGRKNTLERPSGLHGTRDANCVQNRVRVGVEEIESSRHRITSAGGDGAHVGRKATPHEAAADSRSTRAGGNVGRNRVCCAADETGSSSTHRVKSDGVLCTSQATTTTTTTAVLSRTSSSQTRSLAAGVGRSLTTLCEGRPRHKLACAVATDSALNAPAAAHRQTAEKDSDVVLARQHRDRWQKHGGGGGIVRRQKLSADDCDNSAADSCSDCSDREQAPRSICYSKTSPLKTTTTTTTTSGRKRRKATRRPGAARPPRRHQQPHWQAATRPRHGASNDHRDSSESTPPSDPSHVEPSTTDDHSSLTAAVSQPPAGGAQRRRRPSAGSKAISRTKPASVSVVSTCSVVFSSPTAVAESTVLPTRRRSTPSFHELAAAAAAHSQQTSSVASVQRNASSISTVPSDHQIRHHRVESPCTLRPPNALPSFHEHSQLTQAPATRPPASVTVQRVSTPRGHQTPHHHNQTSHHHAGPPTTLRALPASTSSFPARQLGTGRPPPPAVILPIDCWLRFSCHDSPLASRSLLMRGHDLNDLQTSMQVIGLGNST